jgi:aspartyl-tRNA(Asn)/glutamyl-tRNA(Gln) amidotransferase subunit A
MLDREAAPRSPRPEEIRMPLQKEITDEILFAPIREQAALIRDRKISPVALTEAYLDRLEKLGPKLGAVVTVTRELALKEARAADREIRDGKYRGPLHGIPYGIKDLAATRGIPTTWGAQPFRNQVFDYDATVVTKLRAAGAVLAAKLAMVELAGGFGYNNADASFTGPARCPWNPDFWAGGSSSGPGAAMAAGLVSFTIGSETSGSIITPAAYSGISGLRPTYGRVSRHGAMALSWTMDKLGPMCRTADCCGLVLAAIAGPDPRDPTTIRKPFTYTTPAQPPEKKWRIGVIKGADEHAQPEVRKNFQAALKVLRAFAEVVEGVDYPDMPFGPATGTIISAEAASAFRDLIESGRSRELRAANDRWGGYAAAMVLAVDYLQAMRLRGLMKKTLDELYAKFDALVAPSRGTVAYPIGVDFDKSYPGVGGGPPVIPAGNLVGQPALSVLNGFGQKGLPTGIQFTGRVGSESRLIALAHAYQQATDWHRRRPAL